MRDNDLTRCFTNLRLVRPSLEAAHRASPAKARENVASAKPSCQAGFHFVDLQSKRFRADENPAQPEKSCMRLSCHKTCQAADYHFVG